MLQAKVLAWVFSKIPQPTQIYLLKRLELGVFLFLKRQIYAQDVIEAGLQDTFKHLAFEEYKHATMFAHLNGEKFAVSAEYAITHPSAADWGKVPWDLADHTQAADGLSHKYLAGKVCFRGKSAKDYPLSDRLAFIYVLESFQHYFYWYLQGFSTGNLAKVLSQITWQELSHANSAYEYVKHDKKLISKWEFRRDSAIAIAPVDLVFILSKVFFKVLDWAFR